MLCTIVTTIAHESSAVLHSYINFNILSRFKTSQAVCIVFNEVNIIGIMVIKS